MSVFFAKEPVTWTIKLQNDYVQTFIKALRKFHIWHTVKTQYKNGMTDVEFICVCNVLVKIGIVYGQLISKEYPDLIYNPKTNLNG